MLAFLHSRQMDLAAVILSNQLGLCLLSMRIYYVEMNKICKINKNNIKNAFYFVFKRFTLEQWIWLVALARIDSQIQRLVIDIEYFDLNTFSTFSHWFDLATALASSHSTRIHTALDCFCKSPTIELSIRALYSMLIRLMLHSHEYKIYFRIFSEEFFPIVHSLRWRNYRNVDNRIW